MMASSHIAEEFSSMLDEIWMLVSEELQVVSYKWAARHFSISSNMAKRLLFLFAEQHRGKVRTTYLVAGWSKAGEEATSQHVIRLIDALQLSGYRETLYPVTSMHVYSVAPPQPLDPVTLWQQDYKQSQDMLQAALAPETRDAASVRFARSNGCSAIRFLAPPAVATAPSQPANASGGGAMTSGVGSGGRVAPSRGRGPEPRAVVNNVAAAAAAATVAATTRDQAALRTTEVSPPKPASLEESPVLPQQAPAAPPAAPLMPASAAALAAAPPPAAVPVCKATLAAGGGKARASNQLAALWNKMPAKTSRPAAKPVMQAPALAPPTVQEVDAAVLDVLEPMDTDDVAAPPPEHDGSLDSNAEVEAEEEDLGGAHGGATKRARRAYVADDSDEDMPLAAPSPAMKAALKACPRPTEAPGNTADEGGEQALEGAASPAMARAAALNVRGGAAPKSAAVVGKAAAPNAAQAATNAGTKVAGKRNVTQKKETAPGEEVAGLAGAAVPAKPPTKRAGKGAAMELQEDADMPGQGAAVGAADAAVELLAVGPADKLAPRSAASGAMRQRKVTRVTYNERGEEVTEEVMEDVPPGEAMPAARAPINPAPPKPAAKAPVAALKGAKGSGGAKGKAAASGGQKGIQSFFAKK